MDYLYTQNFSMDLYELSFLQDMDDEYDQHLGITTCY